jgi:hypothetical protein
MRASAILISACALIAAPTLALADPTGTYNVVGRNADDGSTYKGTAKVSRTGTTYKVIWLIAGKQSTGTGLGTHLENDGKTIVTGPASDRDIGLSVGYLNKDSYGIATYYRQSDGTWSGVWAYGGSQNVTVETWTPQ